MNNLFLKTVCVFALLVTVFTAKQAFANTCTPTGAGGNWSSSATWTACGGVAPTAADDVQLNNAVNVTIDGTSGSPNLARSLDMTGYTGTLTQGATGVLTLGDATAGASSIALKVAGTYSPNAASTINFISTSATQQTVDCGSSTMGNLTFNSASNGNYAFTTACTTATASTVNLTKGVLHTDGASDNSTLAHSWGKFDTSNSNTRTFNPGNSNITLKGTGVVFTSSTISGLTVSANTATTTLTGASVSPNYGGKNWNGMSVVITGGGTISLGSGTTIGTIKNFTVTGTAVKTDNISLTAAMTVTGNTSFNGQSATNRLLVFSSTVATQRTITNTGGTDSSSNVDFRDIKLSTTMDISAASSGDCGGNSGITFTTSVQLYWRTAAGGNWSSAGNWDTNPSATSRVPLCQDDVSFSASAGGVNLNSGITVTIDMPRAGRSIDFTGMTNTGTKPIISFSVIGAITSYGSLTLLSSSAMTWTVGSTYTLEGRAANMPAGGWVITSAGQTAFFGLVQNAVGGTYKLGDALTISSSWSHAWGNFDANGFNVTSPGYNANTGDSTSAKTITLGSGTWTLTGTGFLWQLSASNTLVGTGSTLIFSNTTATAKTFTGSGKTYNNITFSGDNITVASSNTFTGTFAVSNAGLTNGVALTAATTQTVATFTTNGSVGSLAIATSTSNTVAGTLTKSGGGTVCVDYMKLTRIAGTPSSTWYVGANSTDVAGNTGLTFTACPATSSGPKIINQGKIINMSKLISP